MKMYYNFRVDREQLKNQLGKYFIIKSLIFIHTEYNRCIYTNELYLTFYP